jgi:hypothetical protein
MIYGMLDNRGKSNIWTPNSILGGAVNVIRSGNSTDGDGGGFKLNPADLYNFRIIEQEYTNPMANRQFENIPNNYIRYLKLYQLVTRVYNANKKNISLGILLKITAEALTGAVNSYYLNVANVELNIINTELCGVIDEFVSKVNVHTVYAHTYGRINMTQVFELAPLFKHYIQLYGLPDPGVGFDPNKLLIVLQVLEDNGIDPYN